MHRQGLAAARRSPESPRRMTSEILGRGPLPRGIDQRPIFARTHLLTLLVAKHTSANATCTGLLQSTPHKINFKLQQGSQHDQALQINVRFGGLLSLPVPGIQLRALVPTRARRCPIRSPRYPKHIMPGRRKLSGWPGDVLLSGSCHRAQEDQSQE